mmetsp:Transcript_22190/g.46810  ORF Transcript_22190/g.46810 Transcript_22190/m.46810 type:complete len:83 (-) Transcript_22190:281-529(-)
MWTICLAHKDVFDVHQRLDDECLFATEFVKIRATGWGSWMGCLSSLDSHRHDLKRHVGSTQINFSFAVYHDRSVSVSPDSVG